MSRCRATMTLSKNALTAFGANAPQNCSISTQNVIDKTKNIISDTATATKEAAMAAKEKVESVIGLSGGKTKYKANQRIKNSEDLAKEDYINREKSGAYEPGSYGEKIGIHKTGADGGAGKMV